MVLMEAVLCRACGERHWGLCEGAGEFVVDKVANSRSSSTEEQRFCKPTSEGSIQGSGFKNSNTKKAEQLGMSPGKASGRLKKEIMFNLLSRLGENICFQCLKTIDSADDLSIEHKKPWLNSEDPCRLFYDPENIAFSH